MSFTMKIHIMKFTQSSRQYTTRTLHDLQDVALVDSARAFRGLRTTEPKKEPNKAFQIETFNRAGELLRISFLFQLLDAIQ